MSIAKLERKITARGGADDDSRRLRVVHEHEKVDLPAAERAVRDLLLALGRDPSSPHLTDTPRRVATSFAEMLTPREFDLTTFPNDEHYDELVLARDIPVQSLCEHHMLPFTGVAHVGYLPGERILGLSKLARVVELFARDLQVQERLTAQVADALVDRLSAAGADLRLDTRVQQLRPVGQGTEAVLEDGSVETIDAVVLAGGVAGSAVLLTEPAPAAASALSRVPLASSTVVTLAYPAEAFEKPVTSHGWLEADPAPISGITVSSAKWAGRAPEDMVLIRAFVPERVGPIASAPDAELLAAVTGHVGTVLAATGEPALVRIARWPAMMPKYVVGHLDTVAAADAGLAHLPSWRLAGSALRGVGVPDCVADGRRQATLALLGVPARAARVDS